MMRVGRLSVAILLLSAAAVPGCRRKPAPIAEVPQPDPQIAAAHSPDYYNKIPDDTLARGQQSAGLALGLKIPDATYPAGAPIPFHLLLEDIAATEPIASGLCTGVLLNYTNLTDPTTQSVKIDNRRCFDTIPNPDETPLEKGKLKQVDITQRDASYVNLEPGTYLFSVTWNPYAAGRGTIAGRETYATLQSNIVKVTITPGPAPVHAPPVPPAPAP